MKPDVVYSLKKSDVNEELRHSLRSLKNIPHGKIFLSGYMPSWVNPETVCCIPTEQVGSKYKNSGANLRAAVGDDRVSECFYLFNDDFFILKPIEIMPVLHRGSLDDFIKCYERATGYVSGAIRTKKMLESLMPGSFCSYELHVPMLMKKSKLQEAHKLHDRLLPEEGVHIRTLYGNYHGIGGTQTKDVKVYHNQSFDRRYADMTFLSSSDYSFRYGDVGRYIRRNFKDKCDYEK